jgi:hypothetical protein
VISDQRIEGRWENEEEEIDGNRGWMFDWEEFIAEKGSRKLEDRKS